jgi:hypothetical protein
MSKQAITKEQYQQQLKQAQHSRRLQRNKMNFEKLEEMHSTVSKQMIPFIESLIKPDEHPEKMERMRELRTILIDEHRPDITTITKGQLDSFVSRKKKEAAPVQRGVNISDIASYSQLRSELTKKERDLERISAEVDGLKKKKAAVLGKMSDNATDIIMNAFLSVQASEANRLKRKYQSDRLGSRDSNRSDSGGDEPFLTAPSASSSVINDDKSVNTDAKAGGATTSSAGWFGLGK